MSSGKVLLRRLPCFACASKYGNISEVFLLQFSELSDKERFCFIKREAVVIARNVWCGSFILMPPFLGCTRMTAKNKLRALYYRWILINSSLGVFVKAGIRQSLARILAPLATGHRDICFLLFFFLCISQREQSCTATRWAPECPVPQKFYIFFPLLC